MGLPYDVEWWERYHGKNFMKYNPLDGDRAANYYNSLPESKKEGIMSLDEALELQKKKNIGKTNKKKRK